MVVKFGIPLLAVTLLGYAFHYVAKTRQTWPDEVPVINPPRAPFAQTVAGSGMIEAETENIAVGSPVAGVIVEVQVEVGQQVAAGAPLFRLDDRSARAELAVRESSLLSAKADLARLDLLPRPEDLPVFEATIRQREAALANLKYMHERMQRLAADGTAAEQEQVDAENRWHEAQALLEQSQAELARLRAGAWAPDKSVAQAAVSLAAAQVEQARTELDRLTVRALAPGQILQVNVRPGEFVGAAPGRGLIVYGSVQALHVRVDIDEFDIPRFRPQAPAHAILQGHADKSFPLRFVRVEPYVIPKRSLTGDNAERVDTRVLQVIYAVEGPGDSFYVGQQVDVFVDAKDPANPPAHAAEGAAQPAEIAGADR
jgi:multidrug resistance efflux pump